MFAKNNLQTLEWKTRTGNVKQTKYVSLLKKLRAIFEQLYIAFFPPFLPLCTLLLHLKAGRAIGRGKPREEERIRVLPIKRDVWLKATRKHSTLKAGRSLGVDVLERC